MGFPKNNARAQQLDKPETEAENKRNVSQITSIDIAEY